MLTKTLISSCQWGSLTVVGTAPQVDQVVDGILLHDDLLYDGTIPSS